MDLPPLDQLALDALNERLSKLEQNLSADGITVFGPILYGVDNRVYQAVRSNGTKREKAVVVIDTVGGLAEVVERMVHVLRHSYKELIFIVPDKAMSSGTIFVMAGDRILMNPFSTLGPIDPQIFKDQKLIPALSYLNQFEALVEKSKRGELTTAEYALIEKLDLGELDTFKQARDLSVELVKNWLANYKFKDWTETETRRAPVDQKMREERAKQIAEALSNNERWHSHARGLNIDVLRDELNLRVEDYSEDAQLFGVIHGYFDLFLDMMRQKKVESFVHTRYFH